MPIYEYACSDCEHRFELLVHSEPKAKELKCPACGAKRVARLMSLFSAREGAKAAPSFAGGCGRCGDPAGPCSMMD